jgi:hypothetical protein
MAIEIIPLNEDDLDKIGIYRIWFGHKYYIGATMNTTCRIENHVKAINKGFHGERIGKNSITNIVRYLAGHFYIKTAFFELLE